MGPSGRCSRRVPSRFHLNCLAKEVREAHFQGSLAVDRGGRRRRPAGAAVPRAQRRVRRDQHLDDEQVHPGRPGRRDHLHRRRPGDPGDPRRRGAPERRQGRHALHPGTAGVAPRAGGQAGGRRDHQGGQLREPAAQPGRLDPGHAAALRGDHLAVPLPDEPGPGRWRPRRHAVRQVQGQADLQGHAEDHVQRRGRLRGGHRGARRDQGVPPGAREVPGRRRQDPQGRAALRTSGHRQDAARPRGRRRGRRPLLLHLRLGLRRDVRRRRRQPGPRPLRAGQGERPGDRLHRRDRRRRPAPRRRHGRRPRRARADPQPAARRDGRLRRARRGHPDRRDQPSRRARPGAAATRSLRPPDRRRRPRPQRSAHDPPGPLAREADGPGRRPAQLRPSYPRLHRRRPGQRAQRGRAADRPQQRQADRQRGARRGDRPGHRRTPAADPADEREGEARHGVPRGRSRAGRRGAARQRPGAQGHDPAPRPGPGLHDGAARHRQVLPDPLGAARQARLHDGRPGRGGDGLPRPDHRCRQRHREGHQPGPGDGHAVRHDRAPRRGQARRRRLRALHGPRHGPPAQLLRGRRRDGRRRGEEVRGRRAPGGLRHPRGEPRRPGLPGPGAAGQGDPRQGAGRPGLRAAAPASRPARLDRLAGAQPVLDPADRDPAGDPRPGGGQRPDRPRGARAASSSRLRVPVATCTGTPSSTAVSASRRGPRRRHDRPDQLLRAAARGRARRSTTTVPRRPSASCWRRSARTPSARGCETPRRGWPGRTPS